MEAENRLPINALRSAKISLSAKGLLCVILDPGSCWNGTMEELMFVTGTGRHVIKRCLTELETAGFLSRKNLRENGRFAKCVYSISKTAFEC